MLSRRTLCVPVLLFLSSWEAQCGAQYFANAGGVVVVLVPTDDANKFVAEIKGTRSELDRAPIELTLDKANSNDLFYFYKVQGKSKFVLNQRKNQGGLTVISPTSGEIQTFFNPKLTKGIDSKLILDKAYFRRTGSVDLSEDTKRFDLAIDQVNEVCGAKIAGSIVSSGDPKIAQGKDIAGLCADSVSGISALCNDSVGKKAVSTGIKKVLCRPGQEWGVHFQNGELALNFSKNDPSLYFQTKGLLEDKL